jgi:hypothetical protein
MDELSPTDLEGQEAAKKQLDAEKRKKREREIADFKRVMGDAWGRRFVWRLMTEAKVFHDCSATDPQEMAKFLGERRQGLRLMQEVLEVCPEHWADMIKDQRKT